MVLLNLWGSQSLDTVNDGLMPLAPTYTTLHTSPKIVAHQFAFSELAMEMAQIDDGIGDIRAQLREHILLYTRLLLQPLR